jgi:hypothetical protein
MRIYIYLIVLSWGAMHSTARMAVAGDFPCAHCGCGGPCRKVCRLVSEEKTVSIPCWGCKCEDVCLPGPSKPGCEHCELVCGTCEECGGSAVRSKPQPFVWNDWIPGSAKVHTKKKLMKKNVTKKVPSYKWIVEDLCEKCADKVTAPLATFGAAAKLAPHNAE